MKILTNNKKAYYEYFVQDSFEAGIVLTGCEVKSVRQGHISINESFISIKNNEVYLKNCYIKSYQKANDSIDETVARKLLLHKNEIKKLQEASLQKGLTIIPLKVYLKDELVKIEIAIAKGKKLYDKRETIQKREQERNLLRELKRE